MVPIESPAAPDFEKDGERWPPFFFMNCWNAPSHTPGSASVRAWRRQLSDHSKAEMEGELRSRKAGGTLQMDGTYEVSRGRCFHLDASRCSLYGQSLVKHNEGRLNDITGWCYHLDAPHCSLYE